ncbi:MAG: histidine--tRNA ligase [Flavobacteriales bacterium]|nr:histidine--tRNA ligase [Flavobacteriales bacterium]
MTKPSVPKGTRDFSPVQMARRNHIFSVIREVFHLHGYQAIETPAMEHASTLLGKYGEEGDRLIFRILDSGDFLKDVDRSELAITESRELTGKISEKALRYDLTVPFARYVVQHQNDINFPFKRYQIQPVWRADRPQKGRYREFYQCDADVIGSDSLLNEVELIQIISKVLERLKIPGWVLKVNNRKILAGMAALMGAPERITDLTVAMDKLDKIGLEAVQKEWLERGFSQDAVNLMTPLLEINGDSEDKMNTLRLKLADIEVGQKGIGELTDMWQMASEFIGKEHISFEPSLARGLNYYTGAIFEVGVPESGIGSIIGGGRYDDLTGIFGLAGMSGVGISFGADRIYDVMETFNLFPETSTMSTQLMFVNFGEEEEKFCMKAAHLLRKKGVRVEVYPGQVKLKKQMQYANQKSIPWVALVGEEELKSGQITLKNMESGEQQKFDTDALADYINRSHTGIAF